MLVVTQELEPVRAGFEAFNAGDPDECLARMAPDFINLAELPGPSTDVKCGGKASR